jgi:hypothetical protein
MKLKQKKLNLKKTRFDLEQAIMSQWMIADDIKTVFDYFYERHESMTVDELANALLGLHQMAQMRGELAFEIFEQMIKDGQIRNPTDENTEALTAAIKESLRGGQAPGDGHCHDQEDD